jgi:single-stranded-DNA-specific exonuclease
VDLEIGLDEVTDQLESTLKHMEPCGMGNPSPTLVARGVRVAGAVRAIGRDGLRLTLTQGSTTLPAVGWGLAPRSGELTSGATIDVAFRVERDEWNGRSLLQARLIDFRPSAPASVPTSTD